MIPVYQPYMTGREKEYVNQCLDSNWISSRGEFIERFEDQFAALCQRRLRNQRLQWDGGAAPGAGGIGGGTGR